MSGPRSVESRIKSRLMTMNHSRTQSRTRPSSSYLLFVLCLALLMINSTSSHSPVFTILSFAVASANPLPLAMPQFGVPYRHVLGWSRTKPTLNWQVTPAKATDATLAAGPTLVGAVAVAGDQVVTSLAPISTSTSAISSLSVSMVNMIPY